MLTLNEARDRAHDLVSRAIAAGADAADVIYSGHDATSVNIRLGVLEDVERSESADIGLRVFVGSRSASGSTSDMALTTLDALVDRTVKMARLAPEDPYAGLAAAELLAKGPFADFDGDDPAIVEPGDIHTSALAAENAARAVAGVTNSEGASASTGRSVSALATSHGFAAARSDTSHSISASVLAGTGADMQRDYAYHSTRHRSDLDAPDAIGAEAGRRAVARCNPVRLPSGAMPVVFDPRVSGSLIGHLVGAISGSAIARKTSFLLDALGTAVFARDICIIDDPWRKRGLRSRAFDGEGLATRPMNIIDGGILTSWLADSASARQIGIAPTGHAARGGAGAPHVSPSNVHMAAGTISPAAMIAEIGEGFYVTELIGMGVDGLTGDYSRGASGFRISGGALAEPVSEVTIAGNLKTMFAAIRAADNLVFRYAVNAPTLRIDGMMIAGT